MIKTLMMGRRSVRQNKDKNVTPELMQRILDLACHAPTGVNFRQVLFTVVDDKKIMAKLRQKTMDGVARLMREGKLPLVRDYFNDCIKDWKEEGIDTIYCSALHLAIASAPDDCATPEVDCLIALAK